MVEKKGNMDSKKRPCRNAKGRRHHGRDNSRAGKDSRGEAGACAVMALERVPADIRVAGGVARMADPTVILRIMDAVTIPVL